ESEATLTVGDESRIHHLVKVPLFDTQGAPYAICTIATDITERKQAEARQRTLAQERDQLLRQLRLVLDRTPIGCVLSDADLRITYWNPAAEKIFGFRQAEVLGRLPQETFVRPSDAHKVTELLQRLESSETIASGINKHLTKAGETILCEWSNTPL